ncbi:MAG: competence-specific regulator [Chloroflexi bacterium]|jgi:hypothetical protein|nr:competence-specific regulator [Chloroflexota bacterium]
MHISKLKGIGPGSAEKLADVGIKTADQLEEVGAVGAYRLLKDAFPQWTSLNALWGMQSALMETDWRELPVELKELLLAELNS